MTKNHLLHIGSMNTTLYKFIYSITKKLNIKVKLNKYSNGVIN